MLPIKHILSPVDFSEASYVALKQAAELSNHFHAELCILHVVPPVPTPLLASDYSFHVPKYEETLHDDALERLKELIEQRVDKRILARPLVAYGLAAEEIVRVATEEKVDLIVIATHGLTGWRHLVFGSVTEKVVRTAQRPVLTIHPAPE